MGNIQNICFESFNDWDVMSMNFDIKQLRRERVHLLKKSVERELTQWELSRSNLISHEIAMLELALANCELEMLLAA